jgi:hypothetical protein
MTANVAQVFLTDEDWASALGGCHGALRPGGRLLFEVRDPLGEAWRGWNRAQSFRRLDIDGVGPVETWLDLIELRLPFVTFRTTFAFDTDGVVLTSSSTLRFRSPSEVVNSLDAAGFAVENVRNAPDRPGRRIVFLAVASGIGSRFPPGSNK